jgi:flavin-binding protein dodecin
MTVARVTELSATSDQSFEDAVNLAVKRATSTLRNVEGAWVKDQNVLIENGQHHRLQGQLGDHLRPRRGGATCIEEGPVPS